MQVQHKTEDGEAAHDRERSGYSPNWHPILAAVESGVGEGMMMAQCGKCYGVVRHLRIGGKWGYRAVTWAGRPDERALIGSASRPRIGSYWGRATPHNLDT